MKKLPMKINHNYFSNIDHPNKAYWLGFFIGNGFTKNEIVIKEKDKNHLEKLLKDLGSNIQIEEGFSVTIISERIIKDIEKNKNNNVFLRHLCRGLIDRCGEISKNPKKTTEPILKLTSNLENCDRFLTFCKNFLDIKTSAKKKGESYSISLQGKNATHIINILYCDSEQFLNRKKEKAQLYKISKWDFK